MFKFLMTRVCDHSFFHKIETSDGALAKFSWASCCLASLIFSMVSNFCWSLHRNCEWPAPSLAYGHLDHLECCVFVNNFVAARRSTHGTGAHRFSLPGPRPFPPNPLWRSWRSLLSTAEWLCNCSSRNPLPMDVSLFPFNLFLNSVLVNFLQGNRWPQISSTLR